MNEKVTYSGGEPAINFDDLDRNNKANKEALTKLFAGMGTSFIIQGVTGTTSIAEGYVFLDGEILKVDAHTKTGTHFEKVVTYDSGGDKTFNDGTPRQTWRKNRATITASSGSLAYATSTYRLGDAFILAMQANPTSSTKIPFGNIPTDATGGLITHPPINIGDWNMDTTAIVGVNHALDHTKIRSIECTIRDDAGEPYSLFSVNEAGLLGGGISANATQFILKRRNGGIFDATQFDSTSYNRGWIIVKTIP